MLGSTYLEILRDDLTNIYNNYLLCSFQRTNRESLQISQNRTMLGGQSVDLSDIQALGSVYVSLERR